jgi:hypothetical protein
MSSNHPLDALGLALAHQHGGHLRAQAATRRVLGTSPRRRDFAASLRRAADRLDATPLARRPASQS